VIVSGAIETSSKEAGSLHILARPSGVRTSVSLIPIMDAGLSLVVSLLSTPENKS
jgi:hypothetical protein